MTQGQTSCGTVMAMSQDLLRMAASVATTKLECCILYVFVMMADFRFVWHTNVSLSCPQPCPC